MTDSTTIVALPAERTSAIDWGTVIAGALITSALWLILFAFGVGAGVAAVSPYSWNNPSGTTLTIVGVAWFCIITIGSYIAGAFFVGRFRRSAEFRTVEEREQRDGAHGLVVWAVALMVGVAVTATLSASVGRTVSSAAGGATTMATQAASQNGVSNIVDAMLRPAVDQNAGPLQRQNAAAEVTRILSTATAQGRITNEVRDYIARIVAAEANVPQEDARKRVDTAIEEAKKAADTARKLAIVLAFLIGAVSIIAAGAAYWAAVAGGRLREEAIVGPSSVY